MLGTQNQWESKQKCSNCSEIVKKFCFALKGDPTLRLDLFHRAASGETLLKSIRVKALEGLRNIFCSIFPELFKYRFVSVKILPILSKNWMKGETSPKISEKMH